MTSGLKISRMMSRFGFHLGRKLNFSCPRRIPLLSTCSSPLFKFSTINNVCNLSSRQIGYLLRSPGRNFRYLPSGGCVCFHTNRCYIGEANCSLRSLSKMATSKSEHAKEMEFKDDFEKAFHLIIDDLLQQECENDEIRDAILWLQQVMKYNMQGGKRTRGLALVSTFSSLYGDVSTSNFLEKAFILGWCVEMLQAFFLVSDDIMDQSLTRRGKDCWYRKVGLGAANDAIMLETFIYKILKDHFQGLTCYPGLVEKFREATWKTTLGQCLDMKSSPGGQPNWELFTKQRYKTIVKHKTTWYSFCLPVHLAIILGEWNFTGHKDLDAILVKMGYYFQVQDDYLDCFGDPLVTGKYGSDIEDGKCTWLVLEALKFADDDTKKILQNNYGVNFPDNIAVVKKIYQGLNIPERYKKFESEMYQEILVMIQRIDPHYVKCVPVLLSILEKMHQRNK